jgi:hypothetical protein
MGGAFGLLYAQAGDEPLTNARIENMLANGLPETTILLKIDDAVHRGIVDLDASVGALSALKAKGASEQVLNEILWAEPFREQWQERLAYIHMKEDEQNAAPGLPPRAGMYLRNSSGWTPLTSVMLWLPSFDSMAWFRKKHEYAVPVGSGHSELQIAQTQPSFYVRAPSSLEPWQILRTTLGRDQQRLLHLLSNDAFSTDESMYSRQGDIHNIQLTHVAGEIFSLRPGVALDPGEYVMCTAVPGGPGLKLCYNFGIRP